MDFIKKICLIVFGVISYSSISYAEKFTFSAIENLPDQAIGVLVMKEVYKQLGHELDVRLMPGLRAQESANNGVVDGEVMRIFAYGDQTPNVIRVPTPYYSVKTVVYRLKGSDVDVKSKDDLNRYKSIIVRGVKHTDKITRNIDNKNVKVIDSPEAMMRFLNKGRAQLALTNPLEGDLVIKKLGYNSLELIEPPLAELPLYHYVHKDHAELVPLIDQKLIELKANGQLDVLLEKSEEVVLNNWSK